MSFLLYLLRSPAYVVPRALFPPSDMNVVVLRVEDTTTAPIASQPAEVLQSGDGLPFKGGDRLTYKELFDVISGAEKVITL